MARQRFCMARSVPPRGLKSILHWAGVWLAAAPAGVESAALGLGRVASHGHSSACATRVVSPQKKRPPTSPAWICPGLVIGGARSRNHKKTRRWCDTLSAHLLDRVPMYAELNVRKRFIRVAEQDLARNRIIWLELIYSGQLRYRNVLYAVRVIQKFLRRVFHRPPRMRPCMKTSAYAVFA